ncbi:MAG TPA: acyl-CoA dehydrogenase family protein [Bryobacteraceae bacterium]|nr:acyl-CoA dehydrogenase family protein [Bryobacteraceae bacterium]
MLRPATQLGAEATHEVTNQPSPLADYNLFTTDRVLTEGLEREGAARFRPRLEEFGARAGSEDAIQWGFQANENPPVLRTHDRFGHRVDEVDFHPAWHEWMRLSIENHLASLPWAEPRPGAHVARSSLMFLAAQIEAGHTCPVSMTSSAVPVLREQPELAREWVPRVLAARYDPRFRPAPQKSGVLIGMAMTEKQGGSDVRANTTSAEPTGAGEYIITGHKWFCSAPMSDAFLVLAQAPGGLTCFLLPHWTPDGQRNEFHIQRLKSKLGNRSNASGEVEFTGAWAQRIGEEGRGVATIIEMVQHTRLDCIMGTAALMRQGVVQAIHHARHRSAFSRLLADQPLMQNVLADLAVESEAATMLMLRLARAFDCRQSDPKEHGLARLATAIGKYWISKRGPSHLAEALECLGGNGYVEESVLPRLYREAPVNSVWEGSGNVICLDILRAMRKEPETAISLLDEIKGARGACRRFDAWTDRVETDLKEAATEVEARRLAERLALALQASLLIRHSIPAVAAHSATRAWPKVPDMLSARSRRKPIFAVFWRERFELRRFSPNTSAGPSRIEREASR